MQNDKLAYDDFTPLNQEEFISFVLGPNTLAYEIGFGVGLAAIVMDGCNSWLQLVLYDWSYRDYICLELVHRAFQAGARRVTTTVTQDRAAARELMQKHGFQFEGNMRRAYQRTICDDMDVWRVERYLDVEVYGLLKEEFYGNCSDDCRGRDWSSGEHWGWDHFQQGSFSCSSRRAREADEGSGAGICDGIE